jgi:hypothetical protein
VRLPRPALPAWLLAGTAALPVFVWWLGWYPGFGSSDTIDQFEQIAAGTYFNHHPAIHTLYLDILSLGGSRPGLVALFQVVVFGVLLAYAARWLVAAGVPTWLAVGAAWLLGLSPAIAPTTLALWKDVPFALMMLWSWVELLALAVDRDREERPWAFVRLGVALAGVWLLRGNGPITVLLILIVLAWVYRHRLRVVGYALGTIVLAVFLTVGPLYSILDVGGDSIEPAQVFLPDVAASYVSEPETFTEADEDLLEAVAPPIIWTTQYDCYDSTPLLFHSMMDQTPVRQDPGPYRSLELEVLLRDFDSVLAHRLCAANFVYSPAQPADAYFHRPPYDWPPNTVGLARAPISDRAFALTDAIWRWSEIDSRLWLTWRPAIILLPALGAVVVFAFRARRFLLPSALLVAHTLNVIGTTPAQEFRYAYPLYLMAVLTLPLLWPAVVDRESV